MYDFSKMLGENEKILWQGKPNLGKGSKNVGGEIFGIIFVLIFAIIFISQSIPIFIGCNIILIILVYSIIFKLFLRDKKINGEFYCITNYRIMQFNSNTNDLIQAQLIDFNIVYCDNVKDEYGDFIIMKKSYENDNVIDSINGIINSKNSFSFQAIENPEKVKDITKKAMSDLGVINIQDGIDEY